MARAGLDKEIIVSRAAWLANEIGLENITLKMIAKEFGIQTPSLYNHIKSLDDIKEEDLSLLGHIQLVVSKIAKEQNLNDGYRLVCNCGVDGGQTVAHLHYHLLGGRTFAWPAG